MMSSAPGSHSVFYGGPSLHRTAHPAIIEADLFLNKTSFHTSCWCCRFSRPWKLPRRTLGQHGWEVLKAPHGWKCNCYWALRVNRFISPRHLELHPLTNEEWSGWKALGKSSAGRLGGEGFFPPFKLVMYWVKRDHCNLTLTEARCVYSFDHLLHLLQSCVVHLQRLQQKKTVKQR